MYWERLTSTCSLQRRFGTRGRTSEQWNSARSQNSQNKEGCFPWLVAQRVRMVVVSAPLQLSRDNLCRLEQNTQHRQSSFTRVSTFVVLFWLYPNPGVRLGRRSRWWIGVKVNSKQSRASSLPQVCPFKCRTPSVHLPGVPIKQFIELDRWLMRSIGRLKSSAKNDGSSGTQIILLTIVGGPQRPSRSAQTFSDPRM